MSVLGGAFALALGLALGSFIGLVWDRLPAGEPVVYGRSRCASCGRMLGALDLFPVLGFVLCRGRCAGCRTRIPRRYPAIEAGAGAVMVASVAWGGPWVGAITGMGALVLVTGAGLVFAFRHTRT